ncbi:MAG: helix-turn-helix transcriptional regulator [Lachnospiraceae bacterium]|nr:helix-turn-helix transcriptional regulator [Lachnospiraceae bacterium]
MLQEELVVRMNEENMKAIGRRIKEARRAAQISSLVLADFIGICKDQMSRIENGKVPIKTEYLFILPQCLNVTADYLLYGNNDLKEHKEITDTLDKLTHEQLQRANKIIKAAFD